MLAACKLPNLQYNKSLLYTLMPICCLYLHLHLHFTWFLCNIKEHMSFVEEEKYILYMCRKRETERGAGASAGQCHIGL